MASDNGAIVVLLNMCMVRNGTKVLVLDKVGSKWDGLTFPGGHAEQGESLISAAIREVQEETGLTVSNLKLCGNVHWFSKENGSHRLIFLYETGTFSGELRESREGKVFWMELEDFLKAELAPGMRDYLPVFFGECAEAYSEYDSTHVEAFRYY
ncbi:MAG: 8-oxo-dGTP diphosphatase [Christensenellales bacterium]|jgi:8-oxo-dGTP diphosphatase